MAENTSEDDLLREGHISVEDNLEGMATGSKSSTVLSENAELMACPYHEDGWCTIYQVTGDVTSYRVLHICITGDVTLWFKGWVVRWIAGSMDRWFDGSMDRWFSGSLVRWIVGSMDSWFNGSLVRWIGGSVVRWFDGSMDRLFDGSLVRWIVG